MRERLAGRGQSLDNDTRSMMQDTFGADFGDVRIHTDTEADESARELSARAFTLGNEIGFRSGTYDPKTETGRGLLAHELTHVLQQRSASRLEGVSARATGLEGEAREASRAMMAGIAPIGVSQPSAAPAVQCQSDDEDLPNPQRKKDPPEEGLTERSERSEKARHTSKIGEDIGLSKTERHHALPKFLGGKKIQQLVKLPWELHYMYHRELNHLLEREFKRLGKLPAGKTSWKGFSKLFDSLSPAEQEVVLQKVQGHADEFDNRKDKSGRKYSQLYKSKNTLGGQMRKEMARVRPKVAVPKVGTQVKGTSRKTAPVEPAPNKPSRRGGRPRVSPGHEPSAKTALKGSLRGLGLQFGLGLLQDKFQEMMLRDLEKLPKPKIDKRGAEEYFRDPEQAKAMKLIDLFNKELGPFQTKIEEHHATTSWTAALEALAAGEVTDLEDRLERLGAIQEELSVYGHDLDTVSDNVDALLEMEEKALESAEAADDLLELMQNGLVIDYLVRAIGVEGYSRAESALKYHAASVRKLFGDAHKLRKSLDRMMEERTNIEEKISGFQGEAFRKLLADRIEQQKQEREKAEREAPPKPQIQPKKLEAPQPSLWQRGTNALGRARRFRNDPEAREESGDTELAELWAVVGEIEKREQSGFAHEEEKDALRRLKRELLQEIGAFMDAKSRGDF